MQALASILSLFTVLLLCAVPFVQIFQLSKRLQGRSKRSILNITIMAMLATFLLSIITGIIGEVAMSSRNEIVKCDMTIPALVEIDFFLIVIVLPIIGIIYGLIYSYKHSGTDDDEVVVKVNEVLKKHYKQ